VRRSNSAKLIYFQFPTAAMFFKDIFRTPRFTGLGGSPEAPSARKAASSVSLPWPPPHSSFTSCFPRGGPQRPCQPPTQIPHLVVSEPNPKRAPIARPAASPPAAFHVTLDRKSVV